MIWDSNWFLKGDLDWSKLCWLKIGQFVTQVGKKCEALIYYKIAIDTGIFYIEFYNNL